MDVQDTGTGSPISGKPFSRDEQDKAEKKFLSKTVKPDNTTGASLTSTSAQRPFAESSKSKKLSKRKTVRASSSRTNSGRIKKRPSNEIYLNAVPSKEQINALRRTDLLADRRLTVLPSQRLPKLRAILPKPRPISPKTTLPEPRSIPPKTARSKPRKILPKPIQAKAIPNKHNSDSSVDPKIMAAMATLQTELDKKFLPHNS